MSRVEIRQHGQTVNLEALDPMVEALSIVMQMGLNKQNGLVIDGLASDAPDVTPDTSMSLWVSSTASIKFIYQPKTDTAATKAYVDTMTASLERGGRIHFGAGGPSR